MSVGRGVTWKKALVGDYLQLDMKWLARQVDLESEAVCRVTWKRSDGTESGLSLFVEPPGMIRLMYTTPPAEGRRSDFNYRVYLDTTPCNYGGERWWFRCPSCGRRCRILYGGPEFTCRVCRDLTYRSQQEGRSRFRSLLEMAIAYPAWHGELIRTRSEKKRQRILKKIQRMNADVCFLTNRLERRQKRRR